MSELAWSRFISRCNDASVLWCRSERRGKRRSCASISSWTTWTASRDLAPSKAAKNSELSLVHSHSSIGDPCCRTSSRFQAGFSASPLTASAPEGCTLCVRSSQVVLHGSRVSQNVSNYHQGKGPTQARHCRIRCCSKPMATAPQWPWLQNSRTNKDSGARVVSARASRDRPNNRGYQLDPAIGAMQPPVKAHHLLTPALANQCGRSRH